MKKLWYKQQATKFVEALPVGNGRIGAMVYGGTKTEKISLNENTLWSGYPKDKSLLHAKEGVKQAIQLLHKGNIVEAEEVVYETCLGEYTDSYLPAGNLLINFNMTEAKEYYRDLNIEEAVATTSYISDGYKYERKVLASGVDNILVINCTSENKEAKAELSFDIPHPYEISNEGEFLIAKAIAPYYCAPSYADVEDPVRYDGFEHNRALTYAIVIGVDTDCEIVHDKLVVSSSDFNVYIDIQTNFEGYDKQPIASTINPAQLCIDHIVKAKKKGFASIEADHKRDYNQLFDRVEFDLYGADRSDLPTDVRLQEYVKDKSDVGLNVLLFDYGRYLTIASSREGTLATNLQGIWNEELRAPWSSNYTININTEMNYWHVEACNLSECHLPLIELIHNMAQKGQETATNHYGCRGWCSHHNTDIWASTGAITGGNASAVGYGFWPMSAGWLSRHIWEHYEYSQDIEFLKQNWEIMKGAAWFIADWLVEDENGRLVTPISTSPENSYLYNGERHFLSKGVAMDQGIAYDIFTACIKATEVLGEEDAFAKMLLEKRSKLKLYEIGSKGQILEWDSEKLEAEPTHRHLSLLYGVYPGNSIHGNTKEWYAAAKKTMELRGDEATGWSFGWKACVWARLRDGEKAKLFVDSILRPVGESEVNYMGGGGMYPNMFDAHPPFQIDGNFGITAAICEMLLQYDGEEPVLLPAIPKEWEHGKIRGLKVKGGTTIEIEW